MTVIRENKILKTFRLQVEFGDTALRTYPYISFIILQYGLYSLVSQTIICIIVLEPWFFQLLLSDQQIQSATGGAQPDISLAILKYNLYLIMAQRLLILFVKMQGDIFILILNQFIRVKNNDSIVSSHPYQSCPILNHRPHHTLMPVFRHKLAESQFPLMSFSQMQSSPKSGYPHAIFIITHNSKYIVAWWRLPHPVIQGVFFHYGISFGRKKHQSSPFRSQPLISKSIFRNRKR